MDSLAEWSVRLELHVGDETRDSQLRFTQFFAALGLAYLQYKDSAERAASVENQHASTRHELERKRLELLPWQLCWQWEEDQVPFSDTHVAPAMPRTPYCVQTAHHRTPHFYGQAVVWGSCTKEQHRGKG